MAVTCNLAQETPWTQQRLSATCARRPRRQLSGGTRDRKGADLDRLERTSREAKPARAPDVGGAGHASLRWHAVERAGGRLRSIAWRRQRSQQGGLARLQAAPEFAPAQPRCRSSRASSSTSLSPGSAVTGPMCPRRWPNARVLRPGGKLVVDVVAPEPARCSTTSLQVVEFLALDGSHARSCAT